MPTYFYVGKNVRRQTGRHATPEPTQPWQFKCRDGKHVNLLGVLPRDGSSWRKLLSWMDEHGMAGDLTSPKYSDFVSGRLRAGSWRDADKTPEGRHIIETIVRFVEGWTAKRYITAGSNEVCRGVWSGPPTKRSRTRTFETGGSLPPSNIQAWKRRSSIPAFPTGSARVPAVFRAGRPAWASTTGKSTPAISVLTTLR